MRQQMVTVARPFLVFLFVFVLAFPTFPFIIILVEAAHFVVGVAPSNWLQNAEGEGMHSCGCVLARWRLSF